MAVTVTSRRQIAAQASRGLRLLANPWVAVGLIVLVAGVLLSRATESVSEFWVMPDELGYVKQAIHLGNTGWFSMGRDMYYNSPGQLFALVFWPIFKWMSMPDAFTWGHRFGAFVLASTAIPGYLLARNVLRSNPAAIVVAALTVAVPWVCVALSFMSEVTAYPAFVWALWAMHRALARPSARADAVALVAMAFAFFGRTQFLFLPGVFVAAMVLHAVLYRDEEQRIADRLRTLGREHRVLIAGLLGTAVLVGALLLVGEAGQTLLGAYRGPLHGDLLPNDILYTSRQYLVYLTLELGILPLPLALVWVLGTLVRPADRSQHAFAVLAVCLTTVLTLEVMSFTLRYSGTGDRYIFYLAPVLFVGAAGCLLEGRRVWWAVVPAFLLTAWMVSGIPIVAQPPTILSPGLAFHTVMAGWAPKLGGVIGWHTLRFSTATWIGLLVVAPALLYALRRWGGDLRLVIPVLALVLGFSFANTAWTVHKFSAMQGTPSKEFVEKRDWVDQAAGRHAHVGVLIATLGDAPGTTATWYDTSFWNRSIDGAYHTPRAGWYDQGFKHVLYLDRRTGAITGVQHQTHLVMRAAGNTGGECRFGLANAKFVTAWIGMALYKLNGPMRAAWAPVAGLGDTCFFNHASVRLRIFDNAAPGARRQRVRLTLFSPEPADGAKGRSVPVALNAGGDVVDRARLRPGRQVVLGGDVQVAPHGFGAIEVRVGATQKQLSASPVLLVDVRSRAARG